MSRHAEAIDRVGGKIIDIVNTARGEDLWQAMIKNTKADCIVVLSPNDLHVPMSLAALEAGKIVLCEKPLALKSKDVEMLTQKENIFTALQLRHHPTMKELKEKISPDEQYDIEIDIAAHRDPEYYQSWKGDPKRSGGIIFNLGIHYLDALVYLFGYPETIGEVSGDAKTVSGTLQGKNYKCRWSLSTDEPKKTQHRVFTINNEPYNFSSQDNLAYENLHRLVYQELLEGKGITPKDALPSTKLAEALTQKANIT
jgi:UDP-N-acetyl-2-amino-2-deoxyglucuronate dehydrogenase